MVLGNYEEIMRRSRERAQAKKEKKKKVAEARKRREAEKEKERRKSARRQLKKHKVSMDNKRLRLLEKKRRWHRRQKTKRKRYFGIIGERKGNFRICLMCNKVRVKTMLLGKMLLRMCRKFDEKVEENQRQAVFPVECGLVSDGNGSRRRMGRTTYELMLIEDLEGEAEPTMFQDDYGRYNVTSIVDDPHARIIAKEKWCFNETFFVYGHNPVRDRKDYPFIRDELVFGKYLGNPDVGRVMVLRNKLLIMQSGDFDFVVCKTHYDACRLFDRLEEDVIKAKVKNVVFMGDIVSRNLSEEMTAKILKKTGWTRRFCQTCR